MAEIQRLTSVIEVTGAAAASKQFADLDRSGASAAKSLGATGTAAGGASTGIGEAGGAAKATSGHLDGMAGAAKAAAAALSGIAIGAAFKAAIQGASDLQQAVANISTIKPEIDTSAVFKSLNEMQTRVPQTAKQLGDALYNIFSSISVSQADALKLTEQFAKGATGAMTDAQTFGTAVIGVMNAYKLSVSDASHISDVFFNTVADGVVTGQELAQGLGPVVQAAKAAGVGLDELGGFIVGVTKEAGPAAQNINNLNNFLSKVTTVDAQKALNDMGVATVDSAGKFRPMIDIVGDMKRTTDGMTQSARALAIQKIFPDAQARQAAQTLMSQFDTINQAIEKNKTQVGSAAAAYEKMQATASAQFTLLKNTASSILTQFGAELLPKLTPVVTWLSHELPVAVHTAADAFNSLPGPIRDTAAALGVLVAVGAPTVGTLTNLVPIILRGASALGPWGYAAIAAAAGTYALYKNSDDARGVMNDIAALAAKGGAGLVTWGSGIADASTRLGGFVANAREGAVSAIPGLSGALDGLGVIAGGVRGGFDFLTEGLNQSTAAMWANVPAATALGQMLATMQAQGKTATDQAEALRARFQTLGEQLRTTNADTNPVMWNALNTAMAEVQKAAGGLGVSIVGASHDWEPFKAQISGSTKELDAVTGAIKQADKTAGGGQPGISALQTKLADLFNDAKKTAQALKDLVSQPTGVEIGITAQLDAITGATKNLAAATNTTGKVRSDFIAQSRELLSAAGLEGDAFKKASAVIDAFAKGAIDGETAQKRLDAALKPSIETLASIREAFQSTRNAQGSMAEQAITTGRGWSKSMDQMKADVGNFVDTALGRFPEVPAAAGKMAADAKARLNVTGWGEGLALALGFAKGMDAGAGTVQASASALASAARANLRGPLEIESPSKAAMRDGRDFGLGFSQGIDAGAPEAKRAAAGLGTDALEALKQTKRDAGATGSELVLSVADSLSEGSGAVAAAAETAVKPLHNAFAIARQAAAAMGRDLAASATAAASAFSYLSNPARDLALRIAGIDTEMANLNVALTNTAAYSAERTQIEEQIQFLQGWKGQLTAVQQAHAALAAQQELMKTPAEVFAATGAQTAKGTAYTTQFGSPLAGVMQSIEAGFKDPAAAAQASKDLDAFIDSAAFQSLPNAKAKGELLRATVLQGFATGSPADVGAIDTAFTAINQEMVAQGTLSGTTYRDAFGRALANQDTVNLLGSSLAPGFAALDLAWQKGGADNIANAAQFSIGVQNELNTLPEALRGKLGAQFYGALQDFLDNPTKDGLAIVKGFTADIHTEAVKAKNSLTLIPEGFALLPAAARTALTQIKSEFDGGIISFEQAQHRIRDVLKLIPADFAELPAPVQSAIMEIVNSVLSGAELTEEGVQRIGAATKKAAQDAKDAAEVAKQVTDEIAAYRKQLEANGFGATTPLGPGGTTPPPPPTTGGMTGNGIGPGGVPILNIDPTNIPTPNEIAEMMNAAGIKAYQQFIATTPQFQSFWEGLTHQAGLATAMQTPATLDVGGGRLSPEEETRRATEAEKAAKLVGKYVGDAVVEGVGNLLTGLRLEVGPDGLLRFVDTRIGLAFANGGIR